VEERARTYGLMDPIAINLSFQFTDVLHEEDEVHAVFVRTEASPSGSQPMLRLKGHVGMTESVPDERSETKTYRARLEGLVTSDIEPGDYVCQALFLRDEYDVDWPFTDKGRLDLVITIREKPSYELSVTDSNFVLDQQS
jgi:hypothetical protein